MSRKLLEGYTLTTQKVAKLLGVSRYSVARYRDAEEHPLPYRIVGGRYRYRLSDLETWIARQQPAPRRRNRTRRPRLKKRPRGSRRAAI